MRRREDSISVDEVIAEQARRAGLDLNAAPERRIRDIGPIVVRGKSLAPMHDLVLVRLHHGLGKIGELFIPDAMRDTRNQTFTRATVVGAGKLAKDVKDVKVGTLVVVSEYFGDEIHLRQDDEDGTRNFQVFRLGRERDIVAIDAKGLFALGDRLLMEREEAAKSVGSKKAGNLLYLPDDQMEVQFKAHVVSVGSKCTVKVGDDVCVKKDTAVCVRIDGRELWWINEQALLGFYG